MAQFDLDIIVDTSALAPAPGSTWDNPAGCDHRNAFMIAPLKQVINGNGTADLDLRAGSGDQIRIWPGSLSDQLDDEVFVYDLAHWKGDQVLDLRGVDYQTVKRSKMVPVPRTGGGGKPPTFDTTQADFNYAKIDVTGTGKEWFYVTFLVYGPPDASGKRSITGYYRWDPSISAT